jgi:hypothetical protein
MSAPSPTSSVSGSPAQAPFPFDAREAAVGKLHDLTAIYTTRHVVNGLLDRLGWPGTGGRLLDPAAGDGAFLVSALTRMELKVDDIDEAIRVRGVEIHPLAVSVGQESIASHLVGRGWSTAVARAAAAAILREGDFLADPLPTGSFDFVAGNPPYLRFAGLPDYFKAEYVRLVPDYARADLLHAFLDRCCALLPVSGSIGMVTSDRWISNSTTVKLRTIIGGLVGIDHIGRLDVTTSFYRPKYRKKGSPPRIHPIEIVLRPRAVAKWPITAAPISPDEIGRPAYVGPTLQDVCDVRIAPWLGKEGVFVVDHEKAATLPAADLIPAVDTDDIEAKTDSLRTPRRFAIRTTGTVEPNGAVRAHLQANRHRMAKRGKSRPWWLPPESITLPLDQPALLIPRIARRLRAVPLPAGILAVNHNLVVIRSASGHSLEELRVLLTSNSSQAWIRRNARLLEGGFLDITTTLLRRLPVLQRA